MLNTGCCRYAEERSTAVSRENVSVASAAWGEVHDVWDADHVELVNWPRPLAVRDRSAERIDAHVNLVRRLADLGF